jgi:hypothetical protein
VEGSPELTRRRASSFAAALDMNDFVAIEAACTREVSLWTTLRDRFGAYAGRADVLRALRRVLAPRAPSRIRVMRSGMGSAVLCAYADDVALWTLEVTFEEELVDAIMVWLSPSSPVTMALVLTAGRAIESP